MNVSDIIILVLIGLGAGILSGMFGVGGGILMVPALVFFLGLSQYDAQGTSIGVILLPIGILAAYNYYVTGHLNVRFAFVIAVAFIFGGYLGSKISLEINETLLKRLFGFFMLIVAVKMMFFPK